MAVFQLTPSQRAAFSGLHVLIQPGWRNSGPEHWQSLWQTALGADASRIEHDDWETPQLGEWLTISQRAVADAPLPTVLVCHSLGCILAAHLAQAAVNSEPRAQSGRIAAAFLVAPADVERDTRPDELANFAPIPMARLPFPSVLVASDDDPYCRLERARQFAMAWGAEFHVLQNAGHITAGTGYGAWPEGFAMLAGLAERAKNPKDTNA